MKGAFLSMAMLQTGSFLKLLVLDLSKYYLKLLCEGHRRTPVVNVCSAITRMSKQWKETF